ncbi:MAG: gliding motility-associated C-terminal domain-containing protein [Bacteroidia bacterium]|nr:gliding motility-associated C-terminal domain-containing protein [Bacteroidia bacterium]
MIRPLYILRLVMVVLLPLLLVLAPAKAQTVVYQGKIFPLNVVQKPGDTYEWEIYDDVPVDFAKVPGNNPAKFATAITAATSATSATFLGGNAGSNVDVQWLKTGIYFFKVTARNANNSAMNLKVGMVKVIPIELEGIIAGETFTGACQRVLLDASNSIGDIVKYEWSPVDTGGEFTRQSGVTTEFLLSPSFAGSLPADFRVRLLVTDRKGNTHSDTLSIKIDSRPVAEVFSTGELKDGNMIVDGTVSTGSALKYKWSTSEGKVIGPNNEPTAKLNGAGIYLLEVTDTHGCTSKKSFKFPLPPSQIMARPDYFRTSWAKDTIIRVLRNDTSNVKLLPGSVHVIQQPTRGTATSNADGTITYSPTDKRPGREQFTYEVCDESNQCASAMVTGDIYDAGVTAAEGFSPNGDGINDKLVFKELENYQGSELYIYTRSGILVYQNKNYQNDWDGSTLKSTVSSVELVPAGTYYYILKLGGTNRSLKGFIYVGY